MIIDLRILDEGGGHLTAEHEVRFVDSFGEETGVRCHVEIDYQRTGAACYLNAALHGAYQTRCHRCLESVEVPVDGKFDTAIRRGGEHAGESAPEGDASYIVVGVGQHEVDLGPTIHENFVVNLPMRVVCREDCRGLCPICGNNLNHQTCDCNTPADPRWNALRDLGKRQQKDS